MGGFKKFILRGNVMDLAVAVIIGAAFKRIVDKFVEGIINPALGMIVGEPNFDESLIFGEIKVGLVLTAVVNFMLTASVIYFFMVRPMNKLQERIKDPEDPEVAPEPGEEVLLLREIRDALKK
ncbi:MAG: large conductance mechanosensitive channel [Polyangiales bacterium]|jgi:large conductance mechanosensitive channel